MCCPVIQKQLLPFVLISRFYCLIFRPFLVIVLRMFQNYLPLPHPWLPPPFPPLSCAIVCIRCLLECLQISLSYFWVFDTMPQCWRMLFVSLIVFSWFHVVFFPLFCQKGFSYLKYPSLIPTSQTEPDVFILPLDSNKRGLLMFTLLILIFLNEPCPMFIICFLFLFCCFLCAQQLLWNMGTEYTKYDRTVGYIRPIQLPWPNQVTILNYCMVLHTALMWDSCHCSVWGDRLWEHLCFSFLSPLNPFISIPTTPHPTWPYYVSPHSFSPCVFFIHLTTISCLLFNQITGWPPAGLPQEGASSRYLLSLVAMAWSSQPPRAACDRGLWVCLPPKEGWGLHQPLPLPEGGDPRLENISLYHI